ncbi:hypothetical protein [Vibrio parahaemolyticus]
MKYLSWEDSGFVLYYKSLPKINSNGQSTLMSWSPSLAS